MWVIAGAISLVVAAAILGTYVESATTPEAWTYMGLVALAVGASAVASMVGLGGGLIIVPVLLFLGTPPATAASASLAATLSNAVGSTISYARQTRIDYRMGIKMGAMAAPGSVLGAALSSDAEPGVFGALLAAVLVTAAVYVFVRPRLRSRDMSHTQLVVALSAAASFFAGVVSAYFGVGGGVVFVPLLVLALGMSIMRAAPTSMFALLLTSTAGIIMHALLGHGDAVLALLLSAGGLLGGLAGARISQVMGERYLRATAALLMTAVAGKLAWDAVGADMQ